MWRAVTGCLFVAAIWFVVQMLAPNGRIVLPQPPDPQLSKEEWPDDLFISSNLPPKAGATGSNREARREGANLLSEE